MLPTVFTYVCLNDILPLTGVVAVPPFLMHAVGAHCIVQGSVSSVLPDAQKGALCSVLRILPFGGGKELCEAAITQGTRWWTL